MRPPTVADMTADPSIGIAVPLSFDDLGTPLVDLTFVVVDLETTGGSPSACAITEIGAVKVRGGEVLGEFQSLVNPDMPIPAFISVLTGITDAAVAGAPRIAAVEGVVRLALGTFDLAAELGVSPDDRDALAWSRGALVLASAAARIAPPVDGVTGDVADEGRLRSDVRHGAAVGFTGKLCIHPRQVPVVEAELAPSLDDVRWARSVLDGVEAAGGSAVVVVDGKMVDKPVVDRARRILGATGSDSGDGA